MIPRQLGLEGFMSYRNKIVFSFQQSSLWALCGQNGAGKSTVFDAITYALYGEHRLGKQETKQLIHHGADALLVEFDFAIDADEYRVKRTFSSKGKSTVQAFHLQGPNTPNPGRKGIQAIAGTDKADGFKKWVEETVGLDFATFTASILLQQGKSDALLKATPNERHKMLAQIIDLSAYERLYKRAGNHQNANKEKANVYAQQLQDLQEVDEAIVSDLATKIEAAQTKITAARARLEKLAALKVQAEQWQCNLDGQRSLEKHLETSQALFARAPQIESNADRLGELNAMVPLLVQIQHQQEDILSQETTIACLTQQINEHQQKLDEASQVRTASQDERDRLRIELRGLTQRKEAGQQVLDELSPQVWEIGDLKKKRSRRSDLEQQLAGFAENLDEDQTRIQNALEEIIEIERVLPLLKQFALARANWHRANAKAKESEKTATDQQKELQNSEEEVRRWEVEVKKSGECASQAQQELTKATTLHEQMLERLGNFKEIEGKPTCSYCGQPLSDEHLEKERKKLEAEARVTEEQLRKAQKKGSEAQSQKSRDEQQLAQAKENAEGLREAFQESSRDWHDAIQDASHANEQARTAFHDLPDTYRLHIDVAAGEQGYSADCLQSTYPTDWELQELDEKQQQKTTISREKETNQDSIKERERVLGQKESLSAELLLLEQQYPQEKIQAVSNQYETQQAEQRKLTLQITTFATALEQQETALKQAEEDVLKVTSALHKLDTQKQVAETKRQSTTDAITEKTFALPSVWQPVVANLTQERLNGWQQEQQTLGNAKEELDELIEARQNQHRDEQHLKRLKEESELIPIEAQKPLVELEKEEQQTREKEEEATSVERQAQSEKQRLEGIQELRRDLNEKFQQASQLAARYKELARLLGPDCLQHYLLQKAEFGIVAYTNEVLDRISGGALRVELLADPTDSAKGVKALDLVAYNSEIDPARSHPVRLLSGSQQFRLAVSLALGIGKYASRDSQRVEAVIIDEGFGSLDRDGRRDMIRQLKELRNELKCIIVVFHHEEFFTEFDNKYIIEVVDGCSRVGLS